MNKIILASASPRRKEILEQVGVSFDIIVSDADESVIKKNKENPHLYVQELSLLKAGAAAKSIKKMHSGIHYILSADTIVCHHGEILGKPVDSMDAFEMLHALSGDCHEIYTGFCIMRVSDGFSVCNYEKTVVKFYDLSPEIIQKYLASGEYADKAGGYGIQGIGSLLVEKIEGDYFNVVGLPIAKINQVFRKEFGIDLLNPGNI